MSLDDPMSRTTADHPCSSGTRCASSAARATFITSTTGTLSLSKYQQTSKDPTIGGGRYPPGFSFEHWDSHADPLRWPIGTTANTLGFAATHQRRSEGHEYTLVVPYYAITLALLIPPLLWLLQYRRRAKAAPGPRCPACGYDLRATPNRCPECGRETEKGPPLNSPTAD